MIRELAELIQDDVGRVQRELVARVIDLFDIALGAEGLDDVFFGVAGPSLEPFEALTAHTFGQDRHPRQPMILLIAIPPRA